MIEWLTMAAFDERLLTYKPIGLGLRSFFHGRVAMSLSALLDRSPETTPIEGHGDVQVWAGLVDEVPFSLTAQKKGEVSTFEISFPVFLDAGRIDLGLLDCVAAIAPAFKSPKGPHVENLPFLGDGFGLFPTGSNAPLFKGKTRDEVKRVAAVLDEPSRYEIAIVPAEPAQFLVCGPRSPRTVSRLEIVKTRDEADALAKEMSEGFSVPFEVIEGQLPPD